MEAMTEMRIVKLNAETKNDLLKNLLKRSPSNFGNYAETVQGLSLIHI